MKILVIPDLHGKDYWKLIAKAESYDHIIFLGDYLDAFEIKDEPMTNNLLDIIEFKKQNKDKVTLLLGNHDIQYMWSYSDFGCSGYRSHMYDTWHKILQENKDLFQVAYQESTYLFTHAGVSNKWLSGPTHQQVSFSRVMPGDKTKIEVLNTYEGNLAQKLNQAVNTDFIYQIFCVGGYRGGLHPHGGPLWADLNETDRDALEHYNQIVGHSKVREPYKVEFGTGSIAYLDCLDKTKQFLVLDTKENTYTVVDLNSSTESTSPIKVI